VPRPCPAKAAGQRWGTRIISTGGEISPPSHLLSLSAVRMIWWFLILGVSTLVVVCVAIALYMRLRRHLRKQHVSHEGTLSVVERERQTDHIEH